MSDFSKQRAKLLKEAKRIVVKVGTGVLTGQTYMDIDESVVGSIALQVAALIKEGHKVAVVSSGSVAIGSRLLNVPRRGLSVPKQQAAAAIGQSRLTSLWGKHFETAGFKVGQILLTHDDMESRRRFINSRNTLNTLFEYGVIPVINENDSVAVHELKFGDNDSLAAKVTNVMEADLLAILSDVDGLYSADPRLDQSAKKIDYVEKIDEAILEVAKDSSSRTGAGGMASKVRAASEASRFGAATAIIPGTTPNILTDLLSAKSCGTFFFPHEDKLSSKKHWIGFTLKSKGVITVDKGAMAALKNKGKSLLALGVSNISGEFESGDAVSVAGPDGEIFAKGLVNYHSSEVIKIIGKHSSMIEEILGYKMYDEVIHRDDMVFIAKSEITISYDL